MKIQYLHRQNFRENKLSVAVRSIYSHPGLIVSSLAFIISNACTPLAFAAQDETEELMFNPAFLGGNTKADLKKIIASAQATTGMHRVDVFINDSAVGRMNVRFVATDSNNGKNGGIYPCFAESQFEEFGFDLKRIYARLTQAEIQPGATRFDGSTGMVFNSAISSISTTKANIVKRNDAMVNSNDSSDIDGSLGECSQLLYKIEGAGYVYNPEDETLSISIPQIYMLRNARGWVDPSKWDHGVTAATLNHNTSLYTSNNQGASIHSLYSNLNLGFNYGEWRFRHNGSFTYITGDNVQEQSNYTRVNSYAERPIASIDSNFRIGETYTDGRLFDGISLRGVTLSSDERMLPDSQRGYAPLIQGVARTNARVTLVQNGYTIYESTVPPGPFEISDLYPTSYSGDIYVNVLEADGSLRTTIVPYAAVPNLLRPGSKLYSVAYGDFISANNMSVNPRVFEGTFQYGLNNALTTYGGIQYADFYRAYIGGLALNTSLGAFSAEITHSAADIIYLGNMNGNSYKLAFSKMLPGSSTNITIAAYRFSTQDYMTLTDAAYVQGLMSNNGNPAGYTAQQSKIDLTLDQALPRDWGRVFLTGSTMRYWDSSSANSYIAGYNRMIRGISLGMTFQDTTNNLTGNKSSNSKSVFFNVSVPMDRLGSGGTGVRASYNNSSNDSGSVNNQLGLTGSLAEDPNTSYYSYFNLSNNSSNTVNLGGSTRTGYGDISASVGTSSQYTQSALSFSGGVVAYAGGVKFTSPLSETIGIIEADGAEGARVGSNDGKIGADGLAVVNNLQPYRINSVEIDPRGLNTGIELQASTRLMIPTTGAVLVNKVSTSIGYSVLLQIKNPEVPFGSELMDSNERPVGVVGQNGQALVRLKDSDGKKAVPGSEVSLLVRWGNAEDEQCKVNFTIPKIKPEAKSLIKIVRTQCTTDNKSI